MSESTACCTRCSNQDARGPKGGVLERAKQMLDEDMDDAIWLQDFPGKRQIETGGWGTCCLHQILLPSRFTAVSVGFIWMESRTGEAHESDDALLKDCDHPWCADSREAPWLCVEMEFFFLHLPFHIDLWYFVTSFWHLEVWISRRMVQGEREEEDCFGMCSLFPFPEKACEASETVKPVVRVVELWRPGTTFGCHDGDWTAEGWEIELVFCKLKGKKQQGLEKNTTYAEVLNLNTIQISGNLLRPSKCMKYASKWSTQLNHTMILQDWGYQLTWKNRKHKDAALFCFFFIFEFFLNLVCILCLFAHEFVWEVDGNNWTCQLVNVAFAQHFRSSPRSVWRVSDLAPKSSSSRSRWNHIIIFFWRGWFHGSHLERSIYNLLRFTISIISIDRIVRPNEWRKRSIVIRHKINKHFIEFLQRLLYHQEFLSFPSFRRIPDSVERNVPSCWSRLSPWRLRKWNSSHWICYFDVFLWIKSWWFYLWWFAVCVFLNLLPSISFLNLGSRRSWLQNGWCKRSMKQTQLPWRSRRHRLFGWKNPQFQDIMFEIHNFSSFIVSFNSSLHFQEKMLAEKLEEQNLGVNLFIDFQFATGLTFPSHVVSIALHWIFIWPRKIIEYQEAKDTPTISKKISESKGDKTWQTERSNVNENWKLKNPAWPLTRTEKQAHENPHGKLVWKQHEMMKWRSFVFQDFFKKKHVLTLRRNGRLLGYVPCKGSQGVSRKALRWAQDGCTKLRQEKAQDKAAEMDALRAKRWGNQVQNSAKQ